MREAPWFFGELARRRRKRRCRKVLRILAGSVPDRFGGLLTLDRRSSTLSGGELSASTSLRARLGVVGTLYGRRRDRFTRANNRDCSHLQLRDRATRCSSRDAPTDRVAPISRHGLARRARRRVVFAGTLEALLQEPRPLTAKISAASFDAAADSAPGSCRDSSPRARASTTLRTSTQITLTRDVLPRRERSGKSTWSMTFSSVDEARQRRWTQSRPHRKQKAIRSAVGSSTGAIDDAALQPVPIKASIRSASCSRRPAEVARVDGQPFLVQRPGRRC